MTEAEAIELARQDFLADLSKHVPRSKPFWQIEVQHLREALTIACRAYTATLAETPPNEVHWQPIATAPKDGSAVWVYYDHDSDPYCADDDGKTLTAYAAHAEGGSHKPGKGQCVVVWGGGFEEDQSGEGWGPWASAPDYWFEEGSDHEIVVAATHWMVLPKPPAADPTSRTAPPNPG